MEQGAVLVKKLGKMSLMLCVLLLLTALGGAAAAEEYPELQPICVDNCTTMYMSAPTIAAYSVDEYTYEQVYAIMLEAARAAEDFADLSGYNLGFSDANALYNAVRNENPELFYLVGGSFWSYGNTVSRIKMLNGAV